MTTSAAAHKAGNARMTRALALYGKSHTQERTTPMTQSTSTSQQSSEARVQPPAGPYIRVRGHAGVWQIDGPAMVLTDDDCFEHPTLVVAHQVADPGRFAVIEPEDVEPFTPAASTEAVA